MTGVIYQVDIQTGETERRRDRETERQRDRETERQRDRETERQKHENLVLQKSNFSFKHFTNMLNHSLALFHLCLRI